MGFKFTTHPRYVGVFQIVFLLPHALSLYKHHCIKKYVFFGPIHLETVTLVYLRWIKVKEIAAIKSCF